MKKLIIILSSIILILTGCNSTNDEPTVSNTSLENIDVDTETSFAIEPTLDNVKNESDIYVGLEITDVLESYYNGVYIQTNYNAVVTDPLDSDLEVGDEITFSLMGGTISQKDYLEGQPEDSKLANDYKDKTDEELSNSTVTETSEEAKTLEIGDKVNVGLTLDGKIYTSTFLGSGIIEI